MILSSTAHLLHYCVNYSANNFLIVSMILQNRHVDLFTGVSMALEDTFKDWQGNYLEIVDRQRIAIGNRSNAFLLIKNFRIRFSYYTWNTYGHYYCHHIYASLYRIIRMRSNHRNMIKPCIVCYKNHVKDDCLVSYTIFVNIVSIKISKLRNIIMPAASSNTSSTSCVF